jgi:4-amino-4-deoxy-L-arabinose transferase-like glycosyltransferase
MRVPSTTTLATLALALAAAAVIFRLAGFGAGWLPSAGALAVALAAVHLAIAAMRTRPGDWRRVLVTHAFGFGLGLVVVVALAVRLPGVGGDLGHVPLDIDENRLAASVKHFFDTGQLEHLTVEHYPGAVFWLFTLASFLHYLRNLTSGIELPASQMPVEAFALAARMANVLVAAATVAITGLIGRRVAGAGAGLLAAVLVAILPLSVETTTVVRNDPGMVLAVTAAVYAALVFHENKRRSWLFAAGALAGIATGIKYSSLFAIVPVLLAAASDGAVRERLERSALAVLGFGAAVGVTNHFVWADFPNFLHQLAAQVALTASGHWAATENPSAFYVMILDRFGPGWPMLLLAAAFAVYGLCTRKIPLWIFLSFPLLYLWFMTKRPSQFPRWVYPLLPFVAVAGASALSAALTFARARAAALPRRASIAARVAILLFLLAVLAQPAWSGAVSFSRRVTRPTHAVAEAWIAEHASPGSVVVLGHQWLDLSGSKLAVRRVDFETVFDGGDGGIEQLAGSDWVVVPEPWFGRPALRRLGFVQRFHAGQSFGGSVGYDYEVYAVPKMPGHPPGS